MNHGSDYPRARISSRVKVYLIDLLSGNVHKALDQLFGYALLPPSCHDSFPLLSFRPLRITSGTNFNRK